MAKAAINPLYNLWTDDDDDDDDDDDHVPMNMFPYECPLTILTFPMTSRKALPKGLTGRAGVARRCACR